MSFTAGHGNTFITLSRYLLFLCKLIIFPFSIWSIAEGNWFCLVLVFRGTSQYFFHLFPSISRRNRLSLVWIKGDKLVIEVQLQTKLKIENSKVWGLIWTPFSTNPEIFSLHTHRGQIEWRFILPLGLYLQPPMHSDKSFLFFGLFSTPLRPSESGNIRDFA